MKSKEEFILETLLPYKLNPNECSINDEGDCVYLNDEGKKCAVGKHLVTGEHQEYIWGVEDLFVVYDKSDILTQEAEKQDLSLATWQAMQKYHDFTSCANVSKINEAAIKLEALTGLNLSKLYVT